jgi:hypothetical protein
MNRIVTIVVNIAIIGLLIGGVSLYNYNTGRVKRHGIHTELMSRVSQSPHAKDFKPITWEEIVSGKRGDQPLSALDGQEVVLMGYGKPSNPDHIRDLGSVGTLGMDPCCPKPISYRRVTALSLSQLPYHVYFWKRAPLTVEVAMARDKPAAFVADQPNFFRGKLKVEGTPERPVLSLLDAERLDTTKGSIFGKTGTS